MIISPFLYYILLLITLIELLAPVLGSLALSFGQVGCPCFVSLLSIQWWRNEVKMYALYFRIDLLAASICSCTAALIQFLSAGSSNFPQSNTIKTKSAISLCRPHPFDNSHIFLPTRDDASEVLHISMTLSTANSC